MKKSILIASLMAVLSAVSLSEAAPKKAGADNPPPRERKMRDDPRMKDMTPEEREAFIAKRKAKWDSMSDEEKKQRHEEMKKKRQAEWDALSDEEKAKREEMRKKRQAEWDAMSAEEKEKAHEEFRKKVKERRTEMDKKEASGKKAPKSKKK